MKTRFDTEAKGNSGVAYCKAKTTRPRPDGNSTSAQLSVNHVNHRYLHDLCHCFTSKAYTCEQTAVKLTILVFSAKKTRKSLGQLNKTY